MKDKLDLKTIVGYGENFSPDRLLDKIKKYGKKAGVKVVYGVLLLYYALLDGSVPFKDKAVVVGALGYFILPLDIIPDFLGPLGFTDDIAAIIMVLKTIWENITEDVHARARERLSEWFGEVKDEDLKLLI